MDKGIEAVSRSCMASSRSGEPTRSGFGEEQLAEGWDGLAMAAPLFDTNHATVHAMVPLPSAI